MEALTEAITPEAFVAKLKDAGVIISERKVREMARALGACRVIGNKMFLMPSDVETILEAAKPAPKVHASPASHWTESNFDALLQRAHYGKKKTVGIRTAHTGDYAALVALRERQAKEKRKQR